eukprot:219058-Rhodomonas_salina.1
MVLRRKSGISGTEIGYGAAPIVVLASGMVPRRQYGLCGTETVYDATGAVATERARPSTARRAY